MNVFKIRYKLVKDGKVENYTALVSPYITLADFVREKLPGRQSVIIVGFEAVAQNMPDITPVDNDDEFDWNR